MGRTVYYDFHGNEVDPPKADPVPMTNADRIRALSDEELAKIIGENIDCAICKKMASTDGLCHASIINGELDCYGVWLDWLKKEVEK